MLYCINGDDGTNACQDFVGNQRVKATKLANITALTHVLNNGTLTLFAFAYK